MSNEAKVTRGIRAREILENEEFDAAFEAIEQELTNVWKSSPQRDSTGREHIFLCLTMLSKVKLALTATVESGQLAMLELQHQKSLTERAKDWAGLN